MFTLEIDAKGCVKGKFKGKHAFQGYAYNDTISIENLSGEKITDADETYTIAMGTTTDNWESIGMQFYDNESELAEYAYVKDWSIIS